VGVPRFGPHSWPGSKKRSDQTLLSAQVYQQPGDPDATFGCGQQERRTTALIAGLQIRACAKGERPRRLRHPAPPLRADARLATCFDGFSASTAARSTVAISLCPLEIAWSSGVI
jgi:hypothetical protein